MGTDIWFFVEKRHFREYEKVNGTLVESDRWKEDKDRHGVWISADKWTVNPYHYLYPDGRTSKWERSNRSEFYDEDRDYDLFTILANARDDNHLRYISLPRGIPKDVSLEVKEAALQNYDDFYYHSWLSLQELIQFDWDQTYYCNQFQDYINIKETCSYFINGTIPKLLELGEPEDVRIIFWFG